MTIPSQLWNSLVVPVVPVWAQGAVANNVHVLCISYRYSLYSWFVVYVFVDLQTIWFGKDITLVASTLLSRYMRVSIGKKIPATVHLLSKSSLALLYTIEPSCFWVPNFHPLSIPFSSFVRLTHCIDLSGVHVKHYPWKNCPTCTLKVHICRYSTSTNISRERPAMASHRQPQVRRKDLLIMVLWLIDVVIAPLCLGKSWYISIFSENFPAPLPAPLARPGLHLSSTLADLQLWRRDLDGFDGFRRTAGRVNISELTRKTHGFLRKIIWSWCVCPHLCWFAVAYFPTTAYIFPPLKVTENQLPGLRFSHVSSTFRAEPTVS